VDLCGPDVKSKCVEYGPKVTIAKNDHTLVLVKFIGELPLVGQPVTGTLHIIGGGIQQAYPFSIQREALPTWQDNLRAFWDSLPAWADLILFLALLLLVTYILYEILYWKVLPFVFPTEFNILKVETGDDATTKSLWPVFSSRVREMQELGENLVNPQPMGGEIDIPANIGKEGEVIRTILDLIGWILPRKYLTVRLQALTASRKGKGLSISLLRGENKEVIAEHVFWSQDYRLDEKVVDVEHVLMIPVVIWMSYAYKRHLRKSFNVYGVTGENWESLAYSMVATELWVSDASLAKSLYMEALFHDPNNRLAQNGLGRIWIENAQDDSVRAPEKKERLELAVAYLENVSSAAIDRVEEYTIRFAAMYNLAAALLLLREKDQALQTCDDMLTEIHGVLSEDWIDKRPDLLRWLSRSMTMTILLRYGVLLEKAPPADLEHLEESIDRALNDIVDTMNTSPADDSDGKPKRLLVSLNYRTQFNAACFFSQTYHLAKGIAERGGEKKPDAQKKAKEYAELALDYLRLAVGHGGTLAEYAHKDKALKPLRADFKTYFDEIAKKRETVTQAAQKEGTESTTRLVLPDSEKNQIHLLPSLTDEIVEAFHKLSIYTWSDLLLNGIDPDSRKALCERTKVDSGQLSWWLNLCDLTRVPGLGLEAAVLLESAAKVDTVKELSGREPESLCEKLGGRISAAQLSKWIASAKTLIPALEYEA
jgi:hypothetical protein